jgi:UDP-N-acetylglucosamine 4,6-dehydratase/UDP-glucose 4-epimerase
MKYEFKNKLFLVTGGSGFLGKPLVKRLLESGARVRILARDEGKLIETKNLYPSVEILTGDVSDEFEVKQAMAGVSGVFHLAASKHIGIAEKQVRECIKSNTIGSMNILAESLNNPNLEFVIGISTDKTAQVSGVYGASKLLMERLFKQYEELNPKCDYRIVRYGNVLYSTGSVLCKWKDLIQEGKMVTVTDLNATRFFWTVDQAIDLIYSCLENAKTSAPYVPSMKGMRIGDLLNAMIRKYGPSEPTKVLVNIIGLQPGENLHEKILENGPNSSEVEQYTIDEIGRLI